MAMSLGYAAFTRSMNVIAFLPLLGLILVAGLLAVIWRNRADLRHELADTRLANEQLEQRLAALPRRAAQPGPAPAARHKGCA